jgi:hypothetical protein
VTYWEPGRRFGIWITFEGMGKFLLGHGPVKFLKEPEDDTPMAAGAASNVPAALRALADFIETGLVTDEDNVTIHMGPGREQ